MADKDSNYSREVRYRQVMNPFSEFLPDTWPSNSDDYFILLATKMREAGVTEENALIRITADNTFEVDKPEDEGAKWMYASEINQCLHPTQHKPMSKSEANRFKAYMDSLHAEHKRSNAGYKYLVRPKKKE